MFMDILGICWNNGKQNGNYYIMGYVVDFFGLMQKKLEITIVEDIFGICWDNGKENGNYYVSLQEDKQASRS